MLNPSTADDSIDDPTIRRCIGFAKSWGFGALDVLNIFAYRSTDPAVLRKITDPVGKENDRFIVETTGKRDCELVIAAWGNMGMYASRASNVVKIIPRDVMCLGKTKAGFPRHPLYVHGDTRPESL
jgi:hypothetical protein